MHHYLDGSLNKSAKCFGAYLDGRLAAFASALPFPHPRRPGHREHRTVCLPDFQGIGIGNALSEHVAAAHAATGRPYRSVTGHPAMIHHRAKSPLWRMTRPPSRLGRPNLPGFRPTAATRRLTASFEYVGPADPAAARILGVA